MVRAVDFLRREMSESGGRGMQEDKGAGGPLEEGRSGMRRRGKSSWMRGGRERDDVFNKEGRKGYEGG